MSSREDAELPPDPFEPVTGSAAPAATTAAADEATVEVVELSPLPEDRLRAEQDIPLCSQASYDLHGQDESASAPAPNLRHSSLYGSGSHAPSIGASPAAAASRDRSTIPVRSRRRRSLEPIAAAAPLAASEVDLTGGAPFPGASSPPSRGAAAPAYRAAPAPAADLVPAAQRPRIRSPDRGGAAARAPKPPPTAEAYARRWVPADTLTEYRQPLTGPHQPYTAYPTRTGVEPEIADRRRIAQKDAPFRGGSAYENNAQYATHRTPRTGQKNYKDLIRVHCGLDSNHPLCYKGSGAAGTSFDSLYEGLPLEEACEKWETRHKVGEHSPRRISNWIEPLEQNLNGPPLDAAGADLWEAVHRLIPRHPLAPQLDAADAPRAGAGPAAPPAAASANAQAAQAAAAPAAASAGAEPIELTDGGQLSQEQRAREAFQAAHPAVKPEPGTEGPAAAPPRTAGAQPRAAAAASPPDGGLLAGLAEELGAELVAEALGTPPAPTAPRFGATKPAEARTYPFTD
jgi:hypothetical protein